jgi:hypothetical protein
MLDSNAYRFIQFNCPPLIHYYSNIIKRIQTKSLLKEDSSGIADQVRTANFIIV